MFAPLTAKSRQVLALNDATILAYEGAVRSSKTITTLVDWLRHCRTGPPGDLAMVGRTERTVARNLIGPLQEMVGQRRASYNRGTGILTLLGRQVFVIGANNEAATSKIQGITLAGLYLDEAATLPESFFNMATTRLSVEGAKLWLTTNPEGRNHWLKTKWLDKASLWLDREGNLVRSDEHAAMRLHRYTYTLDDNPFLPAEFVERLKASYTGIWYRRFILSEWTNAEGAIYDMFDPDIHVGPVPDGVTILRRLVGVDYGTTNATAAIMLGLGSDGRLYVLSEWRHDSRAGQGRWTDVQLSRGLRDWVDAQPGPRVEWIAYDPSAASFGTQLFADGVANAMTADNSVGAGISAIASLLMLARLQIVDAPGLISELPGYAWDPKKTEAGTDAPIKINDHSCDALRYAVMTALSVWGLSTIKGVPNAAAA